MEIINWIQDWYSAQCDGDWEHNFGVRIATLDNPGWSVTIDLTDTDLQDLNFEYQLFNNGDDDWFGYSVKEGKFNGASDPQKLKLLLEKFREIAESIEK